MRAVVQRVTRASVAVHDQLVSQIGGGVLVLLGVEAGDTEADLQLHRGEGAQFAHL